MTRRSAGARSTLAGAVVATVLTAVLAGLCLPAAPAGATPGPANAPEYWFDAWQVDQLWQQGARGQGITIAEIDTGVNADLPELAANVLPGKDFGAAGGDGRVDREVNEFGHGTAMASIMVAHPGILGITGLAPDAKILPIAVPLTGTTDQDGNDHLSQAIRWAADHGAKVISMSLGGARKPTVDNAPCPADEQDAIFYAMRKGAVLLASSGNTGLSGSVVEEPGVCVGVISVGAVNENNQVADFSSRHPYLTLTAPGVDIPSLSRVAGSAYAGDGTSQATAVASAVCAIVWSKYPTLSARDLVTRILATTQQHR
ncbi:MAG TPA: S8 family serine peptidase, partial [Jatrophihabitantaceae bacterium]